VAASPRRGHVAFLLLLATAAAAADPPDWMRAQLPVATPDHDEKTTAVVMHSEFFLTVKPNGKIKRLERVVYRILRPGGDRFGHQKFYWDPQAKITALHGWSIPPAGKYFEVKDRDVFESDLDGIANGELVSDVHTKHLLIPSATPGSLVGFEVEYELHPDELNDEWEMQDIVPVRESRYTLQLPPGWSFHTTWINHAAVEPVAAGPGVWTWTAGESAQVYTEDFMPPWSGIAARMVVSLEPPAGQAGGWTSWSGLGSWYTNLTRGRRDTSAPIQAKVAELTAGEETTLGKMRALAHFVQSEVRYVAIELGIGGRQPHPATEVFAHRYGDCKDKATLLSAMLKTIGVESYYVIINTVRGTVTADTLPNLGFDHMILAIKLPADVADPSLAATVEHPTLGKLLIFDPTDELTPLGRLAGPLQANFGLLVTPTGGELVAAPQLPADGNSLDRVATLALDEQGMLRGDVREVWTGDRANEQRYRLRTARLATDQIKPIESMMAHSLSKFAITKAAVANATAPERPFEWRYSLEAEGYAKPTADLLLVRPRVFDEKGNGFLETKEPRHYAIEIESPLKDSDTFEIALPAGYEVDEVPPPVRVDLDFASYHSKTEVVGRALRYTRTIEYKQISIPASRATELRDFFRRIHDDERRTAILKRGAR